MKIDWLVASEIPVRFPDRAERDILGLFFLPIQTTFVVRDPLCNAGIPSWALITALKVISRKKEWLVTNDTSARPASRAERDIFGVILVVFFRKFRPLLRSGSSFVMWESPLEP